jgi:hypothetical protein
MGLKRKGSDEKEREKEKEKKEEKYIATVKDGP